MVSPHPELVEGRTTRAWYSRTSMNVFALFQTRVADALRALHHGIEPALL
jgi:hypothetical protein